MDDRSTIPKELMDHFSGTENWLREQLEIVLTWHAFCYLTHTSGDERYSWATEFCESEPWQFAHMANMALFLEIKKAYDAGILGVDINSPSDVVFSFVSLLSYKIANCDNDQKLFLLEAHKKIIDIDGAEITRKSMNSTWATITWDAINTKTSETQ